MKIIVEVRAGAKVEKVEKINDKNFKLWVKAPAKEGKANLAVITALANYFGIAKSNIEIVSGHKARRKIVKIVKE